MLRARGGQGLRDGLSSARAMPCVRRTLARASPQGSGGLGPGLEVQRELARGTREAPVVQEKPARRWEQPAPGASEGQGERGLCPEPCPG